MTQSLPLREQMKALERLQELDLKIDVIKKKKASIPSALRALDDSFQKMNTSVESKKLAIDEIEKLQRQTQAAMELNRDRIARANSKLEGVQNSQEFQAANKEIDQLKKLNASLEEQIKKSKDEMEAATRDLTELTSQHAKVKTDRESQSGVLSGQTQQLDSEIQILQKEREQYVSQVDSRILAQYDRVRNARGGLGFVPAVGGRCSGCNMMVPPQLYNEVQRATHVQACPSCHRILFVPTQNQTQSDSQTAQR